MEQALADLDARRERTRRFRRVFSAVAALVSVCIALAFFAYQEMWNAAAFTLLALVHTADYENNRPATPAPGERRRGK
jgi:hypothetical protein